MQLNNGQTVFVKHRIKETQKLYKLNAYALDHGLFKDAILPYDIPVHIVDSIEKKAIVFRPSELAKHNQSKGREEIVYKWFKQGEKDELRQIIVHDDLPSMTLEEYLNKYH